MAREAALRCLSHAGIDKSAVDLLVVACSSPDQIQPAVACLVQEKLGISAGQCPAFDVNAVCAGFVFGLSVAQSMMLASPDQYRNVLVIGADAFSKILNWDDRRTCVYFGDGAGAVLLSQTAGDDSRMHFRLGSDGRGSHHIGVPAGGTRLPVDQKVLERRLNKFTMDGPKVWEFALNTVPKTVRSVLADRGLTPADVDLLILHQSNLRMIEAIMALAGVAHGEDGHHLGKVWQHGGGEHPNHSAQGFGEWSLATRITCRALRVWRRSILGGRFAHLVARGLVPERVLRSSPCFHETMEPTLVWWNLACTVGGCFS